MIEFRNVTKAYPGAARPAVNDFSLSVLDGEICIFVGPSGCGKTTCMKMVNRLIEPSGGQILIDGKPNNGLDKVELRRGIGYVIQQIGLFPHRTIADNIGTVPALVGWDKKRRMERAEELLDLIGLDPATYRDRYPAELSGGQQQRVGVARALAADPPVMLMDEPFGAVDPIARHRLQNQFLEVQQRVKKTIIFVTHDIDEAILMGDRIAVLQEGGVLAQYDTPEKLLSEPNSEFVADFVGADRALKRLSLTGVTELPLEPVGGANGAAGTRIDEGMTAHDALSIMLAESADRAVVVGRDGQPRGVVSIDAIRALFRAPVADTADRAVS